MFVWPIMLVGVLLTRIDAVPLNTSLSSSETPPTIKCHKYFRKNGSFYSPVREQTCDPGKACEYKMQFFGEQTIETVQCRGHEPGYKEKNLIQMSYNGARPKYHYYQFYCDTDLCNSLENPIYEKLQEIWELMKENYEILDKEAKKQGNETLFCYNKDKNSISCPGGCFQARHFNPTSVKSNDKLCLDVDSLIYGGGRTTMHLEANFGVDRLRIKTTSTCFYNNCNGEESIQTQFHDEAYEILRKYDIVPPKPATSSIDSNGTSVTPAPNNETSPERTSSGSRFEISPQMESSSNSRAVYPNLVASAQNVEVHPQSVSYKKPIHLQLDLLIYV